MLLELGMGLVYRDPDIVVPLSELSSKVRELTAIAEFEREKEKEREREALCVGICGASHREGNGGASHYGNDGRQLDRPGAGSRGELPLRSIWCIWKRERSGFFGPSSMVGCQLVQGVHRF